MRLLDLALRRRWNLGNWTKCGKTKPLVARCVRRPTPQIWSKTGAENGPEGVESSRVECRVWESTYLPITFWSVQHYSLLDNSEHWWKVPSIAIAIAYLPGYSLGR